MRRHRDHVAAWRTRLVGKIHVVAVALGSSDDGAGDVGIENDQPGNVKLRRGARPLLEALSDRAQISLRLASQRLVSAIVRFGRSAGYVINLDDVEQLERSSPWLGKRDN